MWKGRYDTNEKDFTCAKIYEKESKFGSKICNAFMASVDITKIFWA